jgi:Arc/MetJ-type ribon-helix-helix transcriptional regulator
MKMLKRQYVTLSLTEDLLLHVRQIAARRRLSVSDLLTEALTFILEQEEQYADAQRRHKQLLDHGFDLGTGGVLETTRNSLHE